MAREPALALGPEHLTKPLDQPGLIARTQPPHLLGPQPQQARQITQPLIDRGRAAHDPAGGTWVRFGIHGGVSFSSNTRLEYCTLFGYYFDNSPFVWFILEIL